VTLGNIRVCRVPNKVHSANVCGPCGDELWARLWLCISLELWDSTGVNPARIKKNGVYGLSLYLLHLPQLSDGQQARLGLEIFNYLFAVRDYLENVRNKTECSSNDLYIFFLELYLKKIFF
jgi:hypothetical protein